MSLREGTAPLALPDGVVESARECVKGDRAVYESSLKAVASWVRAYQVLSPHPRLNARTQNGALK